MSTILAIAIFRYQWGKQGFSAIVQWEPKKQNIVVQIATECGVETTHINNEKREWKPCDTHAKVLLKAALAKLAGNLPVQDRPNRTPIQELGGAPRPLRLYSADDSYVKGSHDGD